MQHFLRFSFAAAAAATGAAVTAATTAATTVSCATAASIATTAITSTSEALGTIHNLGARSIVLRLNLRLGCTKRPAARRDSRSASTRESAGFADASRNFEERDREEGQTGTTVCLLLSCLQAPRCSESYHHRFSRSCAADPAPDAAKCCAGYEHLCTLQHCENRKPSQR